jgi:hypothetical protein
MAKRVVTVRTLRLLPKDPETVGGFARELGWRNTRVIHGTRTKPEETVYATTYPNTTVHRIEDPRIDVEYLAIAGDHMELVRDQLVAIREFLSLEEVLAGARRAKSPDHRIEAIYCLALLAPDAFDASIFDVFSTYWRDDDARARDATVVATAYVGWPEFAEPLERLRGSDPDAKVRKHAAVMVRDMKKYPPRSFLSD